MDSNDINIEDLTFQPYLSKEEIRERVRILGKMISEDYEGQNIEIIVILKGAIMFAADLMREISIPNRLHFAKCSSYSGTESTGEVQIEMDKTIDLSEKSVLIIEDIIDTGKTLLDFIDHLNQFGPMDISIATLLFKKKKANFQYPVNYCGFIIDDQFVVGYGMDYNQKGRELPEIYVKQDSA